MPRLRLLSVAALLIAASGAQASSFVVTTDTVVRALDASSNATSNISSSFHNDKIVLAARDDAASFVASQGDVRGSRLEGAFQHIREISPDLKATDEQLAQAILAI
ncbi:DUF2388 domain-containing protein [Pseudomonas sp. LP_7_YM]|uniref:DUF2388 domain-containing protein n=1 Tax=Pseudomonas sp. LP_7_YM TaxID=2485137 RepID=UPI0010620665|nr:DUF2388 domain-containing protein [Pseudomonas sp. LP_7_YM]TDV59819.1 uncharacterized protein (TIGR02448 family) [Pseudomonas sp. LP_7_YM]